MAANLTPQYLEAEEEYRKAQTAEERLAALKKMYTLLPKHKASEKLQADLKTKISQVKEEIEQEKKNPKKVGISYKIPKQGAGTVVLLGPPNSGKSQLLAKLTRATPEVAPYPFTTREPSAGMMDFEDVRVQLIDTPPITADVMEPYLPDFIRNADAAAIVLDLADDDGPFQAEAVLERLRQAKRLFVPQRLAEQPDPAIFRQKALFVANKIDADGAADRLEIFREMFGEQLPFVVASAERGDGLPELRRRLFELLDVIRIYAKMPGKPADMEAPFTCPIGSTIVDFAAKVHRDLAETVKSARVWGSAAFDGQSVGRDHVLRDKDVVELHT